MAETRWFVLENALDEGDIVKECGGAYYRHIPGKKNWVYTQSFEARYTDAGAEYEGAYKEITADEAMEKIAGQDALFDGLVEKASRIAAKAHEGMVDKGGAPYITHPGWVAGRVEEKEAKILAWLHDVLEDTDVTEDDLRAAGFPERTLLRLRRLTKKDGQKYSEYIALASQDRLTRAVKLADLENNRDISRIPAPKEKDLLRLEKYGYASAYLLLPPKASKGDLGQEILARIDELEKQLDK